MATIFPIGNIFPNKLRQKTLCNIHVSLSHLKGYNHKHHPPAAEEEESHKNITIHQIIQTYLFLPSPLLHGPFILKGSNVFYYIYGRSFAIIPIVWRCSKGCDFSALLWLASAFSTCSFVRNPGNCGRREICRHFFLSPPRTLTTSKSLGLSGSLHSNGHKESLTY